MNDFCLVEYDKQKIQYFKLLTKIKVLRKDHSLVQETSLDDVLNQIKTKTLYHKQLTQKYETYPIEEKFLKANYWQTKQYLTGNTRGAKKRS